MRQFQVTVPEERCAEVYSLLRDDFQVPHIARVHADSLFVLSFRIHDERTNSILTALQKAGVGRQFGYVDILPIETSVPLTRPPSKKKTSFFRRSYGVTERLTVEAIYSGVVQNNHFSFDFLTYLSCAALIASAGLAGNSVVSVVAAMLVSPLMGPILAFSMGALINDWRLVGKGLLNEGIALFICFLIGFFSAFIYLPFGPYLGWPNNEQAGRGDPVVLIFGVLVASPSGVAVAVSLCSSGVAGLIGVAISASLLPPAVNSGMLFNYAIFGPLAHPSAGLSPASLFVMSGVSFSLSVVNIACINIFSMLWFKVKRIGPLTAMDNDIFKAFHDVDKNPALLGDFHNPYAEDEKLSDIMVDLDAMDALP